MTTIMTLIVHLSFNCLPFIPVANCSSVYTIVRDLFRKKGKNAQISRFACLIKKALIPRAIGKNAHITVTSFYNRTLCMLGPEELHAGSLKI